MEKNFLELEDLQAKLSVLRDLISIVIDFVDSECPVNSEKNGADFELKAICFANRSSIFCNALWAAIMILETADREIENYISSENKKQI